MGIEKCLMSPSEICMRCIDDTAPKLKHLIKFVGFFFSSGRRKVISIKSMLKTSIYRCMSRYKCSETFMASECVFLPLHPNARHHKHLSLQIIYLYHSTAYLQCSIWRSCLMFMSGNGLFSGRSVVETTAWAKTFVREQSS